MLTSLAFIFLAGLAAAALCSALHLPRIIGMLLVGILLGPHCLNLLVDSILSISADLRQMALIIILIKAGLSLDLSDLRQVGRPAVLLSCLFHYVPGLNAVPSGWALILAAVTASAVGAWRFPHVEPQGGAAS